jgi:hypothetical protein
MLRGSAGLVNVNLFVQVSYKPLPGTRRDHGNHSRTHLNFPAGRKKTACKTRAAGLLPETTRQINAIPGKTLPAVRRFCYQSLKIVPELTWPAGTGRPQKNIRKLLINSR